jgi:RNA-directed DNA polymerase
VNIDEPWPDSDAAWCRVLTIQIKLHQWATDDPDRRFDDLYNLVVDPAFLVHAWERVRENKGARSAGVDGVKPRSIVFGSETLLSGLRDELKDLTYRPQRVREHMIPKANGKCRRLGIATARDRVVQASLKLVLEPIFEADFEPCSYGFRPRRRAHDAIAEIHQFCSRSYEWVLEGDITACFDEISHVGLMDRVRARIGDKRVLGLVKAFLKAGILSEDGVERDTITGTPQGGILSPLLSNIALSVLDEHFARAWKEMGNASQRQCRRRKGLATYKIVRYADDFVVMVSGKRADVESLRDEVARVLAPIGLRLSEEKTKIAHVDEGFDFLGVRIKRDIRRGSRKRFIYTYPSKKALASIKAKVRAVTRQNTNQPLSKILAQLNAILRGWTNYHKHGASSATFGYLHHICWRRVIQWLRRKHPKANWRTLRRRYLDEGWPKEDGVALFDPATVAITRYRYRGTRIPTPWSTETTQAA